MNQALLEKIESEQFRKDEAEFGVGDSVRVHTKVVEGDKERIQIFSGVVIGKRGRGLNETFTVRRISYGEGVERVFPLHSPRVDKIEVERKGRRAPREADLSAQTPRQGRHAGARAGRKGGSPGHKVVLRTVFSKGKAMGPRLWFSLSDRRHGGRFCCGLLTTLNPALRQARASL